MSIWRASKKQAAQGHQGLYFISFSKSAKNKMFFSLKMTELVYNAMQYVNQMQH